MWGSFIVFCVCFALHWLWTKPRPCKSGTLMLGTLNPGRVLGPENPAYFEVWTGTLELPKSATSQSRKPATVESWNPAKLWNLTWWHCRNLLLGCKAELISKASICSISARFATTQAWGPCSAGARHTAHWAPTVVGGQAQRHALHSQPETWWQCPPGRGYAGWSGCAWSRLPFQPAALPAGLAEDVALATLLSEDCLRFLKSVKKGCRTGIVSYAVISRSNSVAEQNC